MDRSTDPMKSVQFAFEIIDMLWELEGAGPTELGRELDIPKSTAYVYLRTLQTSNYVINEGGEYRLSHKFLSVGSKIKGKNNLVQSSTSDLEKLAESTDELVTLVIEEGGKAVVPHIEYGKQAINAGLHQGMTTPLHTHATGKTILSHLPAKRTNDIIETHGLTPLTSHTITDKEMLFKELDEIRDQEYAADWNQQVEGMGVIAIPIIIDGQLKGGIGIACPTERAKNERYQEKIQRKIRETIESISINYRYGE